MHHFNWFTYLFHLSETYLHVISAALIALFLVVVSLALKRHWTQLERSLVPDSKVGLANLFEVLIEGLYSLMEGVIGSQSRKHFPLLACIFVFLFVSNLSGLIPGFPSPTTNLNTNFAIALCVFIYFNAMGIREHGLWGYLRHFMGPLAYLAPLIFAIEIFGTFVRPVSLSLRLYFNMYVDHLVLGLFSSLVPVLIPVVFMILGIFVSFVQAFVFTLLSGIYVSLATAHEHEEHH